MIKPPKFNFNQKALGKYWYLCWVGKIRHKNDNFLALLHFVNSNKGNDHVNDINSSYRCVIEVSIGVLYLLPIGTIYNADGSIHKTLSDYDKKYYTKVSAVANYNPTTENFSFLKSSYSHLTDKIDFEGLRYFKFINRKSDKNNPDKVIRVHVILPIQTLCNYLFFKSSNIINRLLNEDLGQCFMLKSKKIIHKEDKKIGFVIYDNKKLNYSEAKALAPFLFMRNNSGIKSITALETNLKHFFYSNKNDISKFKKGTYLYTELPFNHQTFFKLQGKEFNDNGKHYFMAYRIIGHEFRGKNIFDVDEVLLEKLYPQNNLKNQNSSQNTVITGTTPVLLENLEISITNTSGNNSIPIHQEIIETDSFFDFDIPIYEVIKDVNDKDYDATLIPNDMDIEGATLAPYISDSDSEFIRVNYNSSLKEVNRFEFIKQTVNILHLNYGVEFKFKTMNKVISSSLTYNFIKLERSHQVMVVELLFENKYFYLVEFEMGHTGFIHDNRFDSIIPFRLEMFVVDCLTHYTELEKNQRFWTVLKEKTVLFLKRHSIVVEMSLEHQSKGFKTNEEVILKMANKIFDDRIKKMIA